MWRNFSCWHVDESLHVERQVLQETGYVTLLQLSEFPFLLDDVSVGWSPTGIVVYPQDIMYDIVWYVYYILADFIWCRLGK